MSDLDTSSTMAGNQSAQALVRFNSLFGTNTWQVPANAIIHSAKLMLFTPAGSDPDSDDTFRLHRMIVDWSDTATWNSLGGGVSTDNAEAATTATFSLVPEVDGAPGIFDVTSDIELFRTGTANRGWLVRPSSTGSGDGWSFKSSEAVNQAVRPRLEIIYNTPLTPYLIWANANSLTGSNAASTADPDGDNASNAMEFAYNLNPGVADRIALPPNGTAGIPAAYYVPATAGTLEVEFLRRRGSTGLSYSAQFSSSVDGPWTNGLAPVITPINASWERLRVRDGISGTGTARFGRVVVMLQP